MPSVKASSVRCTLGRITPRDVATRVAASGPCEVEEVKSLGVVEAQRSREGVEHAVGGAVEVASLELGVVVGAHAGEIGHLLAAKARHAPGVVRRPRRARPARA